MPSNIEINARVADVPTVVAMVAAISGAPPRKLQQRDTFFRCSTGRLKLRAFGETAVVEKTRLLYHGGQTRVHVDAMKVLGSFLERGVVLRPDQSPSVSYEIARDLMRRLGKETSDLLATAYADMLAESAAGMAAVSPTES